MTKHRITSSKEPNKNTVVKPVRCSGFSNSADFCTANDMKKSRVDAAITDSQKEIIVAAVDDWATDIGVTVIMVGAQPHLYASAILGVVEDPEPAVVYLRSKTIDCLMKVKNFNKTEATDWYEFEILCFFRGCDLPNKPIFIDDLEI